MGIPALLLLMASLYLSDPLNRFEMVMFYRGITGSPWKSGLGGIVDLPASARPEDVVNKGYGSPRFPSPILETKRLWIPLESDVCWGVRRKDGFHDGRIETLLLYFEPGPNLLHPGSAGIWIVKFYD